MKSLSLLLALFLAPALAAQENNSKTDAPKQIDLNIKIESHGEGIPETVQKMIKLAAPEGAGKYHTLNLPGGKGTMVIEIETSGDLEDVKWALLDSSDTEETLGCSLEDIPSGDCETDEGCCGKCDSTPKAFVRVNGEEVQLGMDNLPPGIRAHIKSALSEGIAQGFDSEGDCPFSQGQTFNVKGNGGASCNKAASASCNKATSASCSKTASASCNKAASASCCKGSKASCSKGTPTTCSKGTPSCRAKSSCSKKNSCGNTGSKSPWTPWNRYL